MFIGHFAVAFAVRPAAPRTSLATLIAAAQLVDLVWPLFVLLGIETVRIQPENSPFLRLEFVSYPWTHSLVACLAWAVAFAAAYRARTRTTRGALLVGALVFSHWVLDWVTHVPDLQIAPWLPARVGLGLWRSTAATIAIECALFAAGLAIYARSSVPSSKAGSVGFWAFAALILVLYFASLTGVPPNATAIGIGGLVGWLFIPWIAWFDRHRMPRSPAAT
jgi:hypothetical protein